MSTFVDAAAFHYMLSRLLSEQEAQEAKRDLAGDDPDLFNQDRQADAAAVVSGVSIVIPPMLESVPVSLAPGGGVRGTGSWVEDQLVDGNIPCPARLDPRDIHLLSEAHTFLAAPTGRLSAGIHGLEQNIQGVGAGISAAADPEQGAIDLGSEIETLLNNKDDSQCSEARGFRGQDDGTNQDN